jgi:group I intron endonuclease
MIIYKTTNLVNRKFYIGKDAKNKKTYLGSGVVLKQAIDKYGKENFKKEILEYCKDLEHLEEREKYWIDKLNALEQGYNLTEGGTGGHTHGDNPPPTWGFKKGNVPWNKGIPMSEEEKQRLSKLVKAKNLGANKTSYKPGKDHPFYGKKRDSKIYDKVVEIRRGNGSYKGIGKFAPKQVKNIEDGKIFDSIQEAADFYNLTRGQVGHSCRKETKKGKFRFV